MMGLEDRITRWEIKQARDRLTLEQQLIDGVNAAGDGLHIAELIAERRRSYQGRYEAALLAGTLPRADRVTARVALTRLAAATPDVFGRLFRITCVLMIALTSALLSAPLLPPPVRVIGFGVLVVGFYAGVSALTASLMRLEEIRSVGILDDLLAHTEGP